MDIKVLTALKNKKVCKSLYKNKEGKFIVCVNDELNNVELIKTMLHDEIKRKEIIAFIQTDLTVDSSAKTAPQKNVSKMVYLMKENGFLISYRKDKTTDAVTEVAVSDDRDSQTIVCEVLADEIKSGKISAHTMREIKVN